MIEMTYSPELTSDIIGKFAMFHVSIKEPDTSKVVYDV